MKVLLVEDSPRLQRSLAAGLRRAGFLVDVSADGGDGLWHALSGEYAVVILDLMLPGLDGLSVLQRLRQDESSSAVLILTARDTVADRVRGLELGADDYLVKPFAFDELLARVRALCRRRFVAARPRITVADLELDLASRRVTRAGEPIELTRREYLLLELLALRAGDTVTREEIEAGLYDERVSPASNVVDSAVCRLRRKIDLPGRAPLLHTRRGFGYRLGQVAP